MSATEVEDKVQTVNVILCSFTASVFWLTLTLYDGVLLHHDLQISVWIKRNKKSIEYVKMNL